MQSFEFATSEQIIFGNGSLSKVGEIAPIFGKSALIVKGGGSVSAGPLINLLDQAEVTYEIFTVTSEPDITTIESGMALAERSGADFLIGFGGGSVLDSAKAIAAMLKNEGALIDYLEVIGEGKPIVKKSAPMIAIPTTAGTGTEVTRNAVIASSKHQVKVSLRSRTMIPTVAIVDPELTYTLPPSITATTGMDAFTQVLEGYVSSKANPMTDAISAEGIRRGSRSLLTAFLDGGNQQAREDMAITSLFGGLTLANGGLGAVHGFAGPIGGMFDIAHGLICASLLPHVMKYNAIIISRTDDKGDYYQRYLNIARWVTGDKNADIHEGVTWIKHLAEELNIPTLKQMGIAATDFQTIIEKSKVSSSMQKNPVILDEHTLTSILEEAY